ncbi:hypothetical protein CDL15_Pgr005219 [Punica granatum]|uniref:F-box associated beta-propeller type 3 domain-containing protein n=1 Tax=Punica granatum TaxID=22663 RepID=A0A218WQ76_PUNGR|nr:hypothetical protein CDL15_Pgr005219 [Punica granatum]
MGGYIWEYGCLVCMSDEEGIQICNPTTSEWIAFKAPSTNDNCVLGYDPIEKKCKILKSTFMEPEPITEIDILTVGEKEWRRIDTVLGGLSIVDSLCIDGVIHMVCEAEDGRAYFMLFEVRLERFWAAIPLPAGVIYNACICLIEFNGFAAVLDYGPGMVMELEVVCRRLHTLFRLWILEDLGKKVWSCKEFIPLPQLKDVLSDWLHYTVGVTRAGEVVFAPRLSVEPFHCHICHLEHASLRKIEICGLYERTNALTRQHGDQVGLEAWRSGPEWMEKTGELTTFRVRK